MLDVSDDSGFMALIVPARYQTFVAADWDFAQLRAHFLGQMAGRSMLIWGTGGEGLWRVDVRKGGRDPRGFRDVSGPLRVEGGSVLLTNYESLSTAAQFADVSLPEAHQRQQLIALPDGDYSCKVIQMSDPAADAAVEERTADFVISLRATSKSMLPWKDLPWHLDG